MDEISDGGPAEAVSNSSDRDSPSLRRGEGRKELSSEKLAVHGDIVSERSSVVRQENADRVGERSGDQRGERGERGPWGSRRGALSEEVLNVSVGVRVSISSDWKDETWDGEREPCAKDGNDEAGGSIGDSDGAVRAMSLVPERLTDPSCEISLIVRGGGIPSPERRRGAAGRLNISDLPRPIEAPVLALTGPPGTRPTLTVVAYSDL